MTKTQAYLLAGLLFGIVGSITAATVSIPHRFTAVQPALPYKLNANFSALLSAVNRLDRRVVTLEQKSAASAPDRFSVKQINAPVGSTVTIGNVTYTIVQFEVSRFDTDEVYLLKFPTADAISTASYAQERIDVNGVYPGDSAEFTATRVTTLSGFRTLIGVLTF